MIFNNKHKQIHSIVKKYFFYLMTVSLPTMSRIFPSITYRRPQSLRDSFVSSHFIDTGDLTSDMGQVGTFPCGNCAYCTYLDTRTRITLSGGSVWRAKHRIDCHTKVIVYLILCPYGSFYVGKNRREFWKRIYDHVYITSVGFFKSTMGKHFALYHN